MLSSIIPQEDFSKMVINDLLAPLVIFLVASFLPIVSFYFLSRRAKHDRKQSHPSNSGLSSEQFFDLVFLRTATFYLAILFGFLIFAPLLFTYLPRNTQHYQIALVLIILGTSCNFLIWRSRSRSHKSPLDQKAERLYD